MSAPLLIRVCDEGHVNDVQMESGCEWCFGSTELVRVFTEDEVRPLWDALRAISDVECDCTGFYRCNGCEKRGPRLADRALDAFSAPEEWTR